MDFGIVLAVFGFWDLGVGRICRWVTLVYCYYHTCNFCLYPLYVKWLHNYNNSSYPLIIHITYTRGFNSCSFNLKPCRTSIGSPIKPYIFHPILTIQKTLYKLCTTWYKMSETARIKSSPQNWRAWVLVISVMTGQ